MVEGLFERGQRGVEVRVCDVADESAERLHAVEGKNLVQLTPAHAPLLKTAQGLGIQPAPLVAREPGGLDEGAEALVLGKLAGKEAIHRGGGEAGVQGQPGVGDGVPVAPEAASPSLAAVPAISSAVA